MKKSKASQTSPERQQNQAHIARHESSLDVAHQHVYFDGLDELIVVRQVLLTVDDLRLHATAFDWNGNIGHEQIGSQLYRA